MFGNVDRAIGVVGLSLAVIGITVSTWVAYDVYNKSQPKAPELSIRELSRIDLKSNSDYVGMQLDYYLDGKRAEHVVSSLVDVINSGGSPIVPADFFSKLTVSPEAPLTIIGANVISTVPEGLAIRLSQGENGEIFVEPGLLNPGDRVRLGILLDAQAAKSLDHLDEPVLRWNARIRDIGDLTKTDYHELPEAYIAYYNPSPSVWEQFSTGFTIVLTAKSVPVFVTFIYLFSFAAIFLMKRRGFIRGMSFSAGSVLIFFFLLSVATSEVIIFYVFGNPWVQSGAHYVNATLVVLYLIALLVLMLIPTLQPRDER